MTIYYIANAGSDSTGNGSAGNPWATYAKAYASSLAHDTISANGGDRFPEYVALTSPRLLIGHGTGRPYFDGSDSYVVSDVWKWVDNGRTLEDHVGNISSATLYSGNNWSHTLATGAGTKRLVTVLVKIEHASVTVTNVTFNSVGGFKRLEPTAIPGDKLQLWEWLDDDLPDDPGTYTITVVYAGGSAEGYAYAQDFVWMEQAVPEATAVNGGSSVGTLTLSLTGTTSGALLVSAVGTGDGGHHWGMSPNSAGFTDLAHFAGTGPGQSLDVFQLATSPGGTVDCSWAREGGGTTNRVLGLAAAYKRAPQEWALQTSAGDPPGIAVPTEVFVDGDRFYPAQVGNGVGSLLPKTWAWDGALFEEEHGETITSGGSVSQDHDLATGENTGRLLLLAIVWDSSTDAVVPQAPTLNGVANGTLRAEAIQGSAGVRMYEWLDATLPTAAGTVTIAVPGTISSNGYLLYVRNWTGIIQSAPVTNTATGTNVNALACSLGSVPVGGLVFAATVSSLDTRMSPNGDLTNVHESSPPSLTTGLSIGCGVQEYSPGGTIACGFTKDGGGTNPRIAIVAAGYAVDGQSTIVLRKDGAAPDTVYGSQRDFCLEVKAGGEGTVIDGVDFTRAARSGVRLVDNNGPVTMRRFRSSYNQEHGVWAGSGGGAVPQIGSLFEDGEVDHNGYSGLELAQAMRGTVVRRIDAHHNSQRPDLETFTGNIRTFSLRNSWGTLIEYCNAWSAGKRDDGSVINANVGNGIWIDTDGDNGGADPVIVRYSQSWDNTRAAFYLENVKGAVVYGCLGWGCFYGGRIACSTSLSDAHWTDGAVYANNTFYGNDINIRCHGKTDTDGVLSIYNCVVVNNICFNHGTLAMEIEDGADNNATATPTGPAGEGWGLNNTYANLALGPESTGFIQWGTGFLNTYDALEAQTGVVAGTMVRGDPQLADPEGEDFRLRLSSPCRRRGASPWGGVAGVASDIAGKPTSDLPTLGAYELPVLRHWPRRRVVWVRRAEALDASLYVLSDYVLPDYVSLVGGDTSPTAFTDGTSFSDTEAPLWSDQ